MFAGWTCSVDSSTSTTAPPRDRIRVSDPHGRRHLDRTLRIYLDHYNRQRPHRALGLASPLVAAGEPIAANPCDVRRRDLLGGLIHEYDGAAA
jgi:hypothetical protein